MIDKALHDRLVEMVERDTETCERLAAAGELGEGYHPELQAVHEANAYELENIIAQHGWPTIESVGHDGSDSAWLIAQHAIALPQFQRSCRLLLQDAVARCEAAAWQLAFLTDRIRVFEGKSQVYGTQFDWDGAGAMSPLPIEDPDQVDVRRAAVHLLPLSDMTKARRKGAEREPKPRDPAERNRQFEEWARSVGWRT